MNGMRRLARVAWRLTGRFRRRQNKVHQSGSNRAARHAVELGGSGALNHDHSALALDRDDRPAHALFDLLGLLDAGHGQEVDLSALSDALDPGPLLDDELLLLEPLQGPGHVVLASVYAQTYAVLGDPYGGFEGILVLDEREQVDKDPFLSGEDVDHMGPPRSRDRRFYIPVALFFSCGAVCGAGVRMCYLVFLQ